MKKFLSVVFLFIGLNSVLAQENPHNILQDDEQIFYSPIQNSWSNNPIDIDDIVLKKDLIEGTGSHSIFYNSDETLAFALSTNLEFIKNDKLIIVDNNLLKYSKMIYDGKNFRQVLLNNEEIEQIFPQAEIFNISQIDKDNKIWLHKPFRKNRLLLLVNDTDKFFHSITCKSKNVQDEDIKGLVNLNRYGIFRFRHFGEKDGQIIFYVR